MHFACSCGQLDVVRWLHEVKGVDLTVRTSVGISLMHCACKNGNLEMVRWLHEVKGMQLTVTTRDGHTPLHYAARFGKLNVVRVDEVNSHFDCVNLVDWFESLAI